MTPAVLWYFLNGDTGPATLGEGIAEYWSSIGLNEDVGAFYHVEIERMGNARSTYEALCCVMVDQPSANQVNVGKQKRGHDRFRRQFVLVGTDPEEIKAGARLVFDAFNRINQSQFSLESSAGSLIGCRPLTPREVSVTKNRLPLPSNKTLLNGAVEVEFILTRGEAP